MLAENIKEIIHKVKQKQNGQHKEKERKQIQAV